MAKQFPKRTVDFSEVLYEETALKRERGDFRLSEVLYKETALKREKVDFQLSEVLYKETALKCERGGIFYEI